MITKNNFDENFEVIEKFCNEIVTDPHMDPTNCIMKNMTADNWKINNRSLLYKIYVTEKYGALTLLYDDDKPIAISAVEQADFDPSVLIIAKRTYIKGDYRARGVVSKYLIPKQVEYAKKNNYKTLLITIDEVMERNIKLLRRATKGSVMGFKVPEALLSFEEHDEILMINHTRQHVFYYSMYGERWEPPESIKIKGEET